MIYLYKHRFITPIVAPMATTAAAAGGDIQNKMTSSNNSIPHIIAEEQ